MRKLDRDALSRNGALLCEVGCSVIILPRDPTIGRGVLPRSNRADRDILWIGEIEQQPHVWGVLWHRIAAVTRAPDAAKFIRVRCGHGLADAASGGFCAR
jgi:hypothetical protein